MNSISNINSYMLTKKLKLLQNTINFLKNKQEDIAYKTWSVVNINNYYNRIIRAYDENIVNNRILMQIEFAMETETLILYNFIRDKYYPTVFINMFDNISEYTKGELILHFESKEVLDVVFSVMEEYVSEEEYFNEKIEEKFSGCHRQEYFNKKKKEEHLRKEKEYEKFNIEVFAIEYNFKEGKVISFKLFQDKNKNNLNLFLKKALNIIGNLGATNKVLLYSLIDLYSEVNLIKKEVEQGLFLFWKIEIDLINNGDADYINIKLGDNIIEHNYVKKLYILWKTLQGLSLMEEKSLFIKATEDFLSYLDFIKKKKQIENK